MRGWARLGAAYVSGAEVAASAEARGDVRQGTAAAGPARHGPALRVAAARQAGSRQAQPKPARCGRGELVAERAERRKRARQAGRPAHDVVVRAGTGRALVLAGRVVGRGFVSVDRY